MALSDVLLQRTFDACPWVHGETELPPTDLPLSDNADGEQERQLSTTYIHEATSTIETLAPTVPPPALLTRAFKSTTSLQKWSSMGDAFGKHAPKPPLTNTQDGNIKTSPTTSPLGRPRVNIVPMVSTRSREDPVKGDAESIISLATSTSSKRFANLLSGLLGR